MAVWALADLHLAFGVPEKSMEAFGAPWIGYAQKIEENWKRLIKEEDLVLIPGDISWAMHLADAKADLDWIGNLPGTKLLLRGNHDYWWSSLKQIEAILPPSLHLIQNNAYAWNGYVVGGARLWDTPEYDFKGFVQYVENPRARKQTEEEDRSPEAEKIFVRELGRLEMSLKEMAKQEGVRIVMTHYPPISGDLRDSRVAALLEKYEVNTCVFGHLHNIKKEPRLFGTKNGVRYILTAADYVDFSPVSLF